MKSSLLLWEVIILFFGCWAAVQVADSLLFRLGNISQYGVNPNRYPAAGIRGELKQYSLEQYIPLCLDSQTVYLSADNNLRDCEDIYKYDPSLPRGYE